MPDNLCHSAVVGGGSELFFLGETMGVKGLVGGTAFLSALFLAATAEAPDDNCPEEVCEVLKTEGVAFVVVLEVV